MQCRRGALLPKQPPLRSKRLILTVRMTCTCLEFRGAVKGIKQARLWRYLIFSSVIRRPFAWAFADAGTLQRGYLDILSGKHEYNTLYRLFLIQVLKALRKIGGKAFQKLASIIG